MFGCQVGLLLGTAIPTHNQECAKQHVCAWILMAQCRLTCIRLNHCIMVARTVFLYPGPQIPQLFQQLLVNSPFAHRPIIMHRPVWLQGPVSWRGKYYQYRIVVFCPDSQQVQTLITTDPYSLSLAADGTHSQARSTAHTCVKLLPSMVTSLDEDESKALEECIKCLCMSHAPMWLHGQWLT